MFLIILFFVTSVFSESVPLQVTNMKITQLEEGTTCQLLSHRQRQRLKVIREIIHLQGLDDKDPLTQILLMNHLTTNHLFLDFSTYEDEVIAVDLEIKLPDKLKDQIQKKGLERQHLSIDGFGVRWIGAIYNFPLDFSFKLLESRKLSIRYLTYRAVLCSYNEIEYPELLWLDPESVDYSSLKAM